MFERTRLGGSLNYFLRSLEAPEALRKRAESLFRPTFGHYAERMRKDKRTADQACVAMITETLATCELQALIAMRDADHELLLCMKKLFQICEALWRRKPAEFDGFFQVPPEKHYFVLMTAQ